MSWPWLADPSFIPPHSASDFALAFARLQAELGQALTPFQAQTAPSLPQDPQDALRAELNEYQTRWYFVDGLLALLGWLSPIDRSRIFGSHPHLTVEQRLRRVNTGRYHWLDYAGFEVEPGGQYHPLLAVEPKRSEGDNAWALPEWLEDGGQRTLKTGELAVLLSNPPEQTLSSRALNQRPRPDHATVDHLEQLRAYCIDLSDRPGLQPPAVALLTNAHSHIAITEVEKWIEDRASGKAHVFPSPADVVAHRDDFWQLLSFHHVSRSAGPLDLGQLRALCSHLPPKWRVRYCNALRVRRRAGSQEGAGEAIASDLMAAATPCVALTDEARGASPPSLRFIWVDLDPYFVRVPNDAQSLEQHLAEIAQQHSDKCRQVSHELAPPNDDGSSAPMLPTISLAEIRACSSGDAVVVGLMSQGNHPREWEEHVLVLGDQAHFIRRGTEYHECPSHRPQDTDIQLGFHHPTPSYRDRCHFAAGHVCHCANYLAYKLKQRSTAPEPPSAWDDLSSATTAAADPPYGRRSNQEFCELWHIDRHLCCRRCAYWEICEPHIGSRLPCFSPD